MNGEVISSPFPRGRIIKFYFKGDIMSYLLKVFLCCVVLLLSATAGFASQESREVTGDGITIVYTGDIRGHLLPTRS